MDATEYMSQRQYDGTRLKARNETVPYYFSCDALDGYMRVLPKLN